MRVTWLAGQTFLCKNHESQTQFYISLSVNQFSMKLSIVANINLFMSPFERFSILKGAVSPTVSICEELKKVCVSLEI